MSARSSRHGTTSGSSGSWSARARRSRLTAAWTSRRSTARLPQDASRSPAEKLHRERLCVDRVELESGTGRPARGRSRPTTRRARTVRGRGLPARLRAAREGHRGRPSVTPHRRRHERAGGGSGRPPRPANCGRSGSDELHFRTRAANRGVTWISPLARAGGRRHGGRPRPRSRPVRGFVCSGWVELIETRSKQRPQRRRNGHLAASAWLGHRRASLRRTTGCRRRREQSAAAAQRRRRRPINSSTSPSGSGSSRTISRGHVGRPSLRSGRAMQRRRIGGSRGEQRHMLDEDRGTSLPPIGDRRTQQPAARPRFLSSSSAEGPGDLLAERPCWSDRAANESRLRPPRLGNASSCSTASTIGQ